MPRRLIDISVALEADIPSDPPIMLPKIRYLSHAETAEQMASFFPGLTREDLPGGEEKGASHDQASVPVTRTPRSSR